MEYLHKIIHLSSDLKMTVMITKALRIASIPSLTALSALLIKHLFKIQKVNLEIMPLNSLSSSKFLLDPTSTSYLRDIPRQLTKL
jgi:hypothetical protein